MSDSLQRLLEIMRALRDPQSGCAWDRQQTFESIIPHTLEEAYEVTDAIERFVRSYVSVFYSSDAAVQSDSELQGFAAGLAAVPQLAGFPSTISSRKQLVDWITHFVFQSAVQHNAVNSAAV